MTFPFAAKEPNPPTRTRAAVTPIRPTGKDTCSKRNTWSRSLPQCAGSGGLLLDWRCLGAGVFPSQHPSYARVPLVHVLGLGLPAEANTTEKHIPQINTFISISSLVPCCGNILSSSPACSRPQTASLKLVSNSSIACVPIQVLSFPNSNQLSHRSRTSSISARLSSESRGRKASFSPYRETPALVPYGPESRND